MKGPIFYIVFLALLAFASCGPTKPLTESQKDSTMTHIRDSVIIRDTVILTQPPDESHQAKLPDTDTSILRTSLAESVAYVSRGELYHSLRNRSEALAPIKVPYIQKVHSEKTDHQKIDRIIVQVEKDLTKWQRFLMSIGWAVIAIAVIWATIKIRKLLI